VARLLGVMASGLLLVRVEVFLILQCVMPFRVGSGSMHPTLRGASVREMRADSPDRPGFFQALFTGGRFREIRVTEGGYVDGPLAGTPSTFRVGPHTYELPHLARPAKMPGQHITQGETLWSGVVLGGDSVLVDKLSYRFGNPQRGDLLVFETRGIIRSKQSEKYIKRIAGLPGERIRIEPPYVIVDGQKLTTPAIFQAIASRPDGLGFQLATPSGQFGARLAKPTDEVLLGKDEFFVLGDNTWNSLDSRHFGPVPSKNIVGKVARVYWPPSRIHALE